LPVEEFLRSEYVSTNGITFNDRTRLGLAPIVRSVKHGSIVLDTNCKMVVRPNVQLVRNLSLAVTDLLVGHQWKSARLRY
jgi:hypothetical protein